MTPDRETRPSPTSSRFWLWLAAAIVVTAAIGYVDYVTGRDLGFFVFYFIPVGFAGWRLGYRWGIALAVTGALTWALADAWTGVRYESHMIPVWNTIIRLSSFLIIAIGSAHLRQALNAQQAISRDLSKALSQVKTLEGLLPICASCKKIKGNQGNWEALERYIAHRTDATFSHGMCPDCARAIIREAGLPDDALDRGRSARL